MGAGADRDAVVDIVARDKTDAAARSARRNFENLRKEVKEQAKAEDESSKRWDKWRSTALSAAKTAAQLGARVASIASLAGPAVSAVTALAKGTVAFAKGAATAATELAPLVAYIPGLVGSAGLLVGTAKLIGPAFGKSLQPVIGQFTAADGSTTRLTKRVQDLATKGVSQLAKQFVKVNMPTIEKGMDRIAVATNRVSVGVAKWVNSAAGQKLITTISNQTATAVEQIGPHFQAAVIAAGNLANQAGGINSVGTAVGKILDKFTAWANSISPNDINAAFAAILRGWADIKGAWNNLKSVVQWMDQNQDKIKQFSTALAGIGIVFGLATGDLPAVAAGAFTLVWQNLDKIKGAVKGFDTKPWVDAFNNVKDASKNVLGIGRDIASTFGPLAQSAIGPASGALKDLSGALKAVFDFADQHKTTFQALAVGLAAAYTWSKLLAIQEWAVTTAMIAFDAAADANPIGLIVLAIVALAAAFAYLWTHSSGFRDFFIGMWNAIWGFLKTIGAWFAGPFAGFFVTCFNALKGAFQAVKSFVISGFAALVGAALSFVGGVINAAAKAFGWVPGLGPKLKGAAADFNDFAAKVNASLAAIKDKTVNIHVYKTGNGATLIDNQGALRAVGNNTHVAVAQGLSWAPAGAGAAANFMAHTFAPAEGGGTSRTGGPSPVHAEVHNEVTVLLDGRPITARITAAEKRQEWRQRMKRR